MSASVGASAAGARVVTATSANGLALMWEILYIAASTRCPLVMAVVNRALSAPINIHCDHSDSMGARDAGWIHLHSENSQEAYDNMIQAVRIAEHRDVLLPVMVCLDGFILSHTLEPVDVFDDKTVQDFVGEFKPVHNLLDLDRRHRVADGWPVRRVEARGYGAIWHPGIADGERVVGELGREDGEVGCGKSHYCSPEQAPR